MYVCGLTVYNRGHIGNFRTFVATDLLRRTLRYAGYRVIEVMNITDVDDRIIQQAQEAGKRPERLHRRVHPGLRGRHGSASAWSGPSTCPRATEHIPEMIDLIERLQCSRPHLRRGRQRLLPDRLLPRLRPALASRRGGDPGGGAGRHRQVREGERTRLRALEGEGATSPSGRSGTRPFGRGRPGWHIECSAMSMKYLGETFDIHCGGEDLDLPAPRERDRAERVRHRQGSSSATGCTSSTC